MIMDEEPRPMEEIGSDIGDTVTSIIDSTAQLVNNIRRQVKNNLILADEMEDIAQSFRNIAQLQQEAAMRVAQIGTESIASETLGDDDDEIEFDEEDYEEEEDE